MRVKDVHGMKANDPAILYCGRACAGWKRSPLANRWRGDGALEKYMEWLADEIEKPGSTALAALKAIRADSVLGCWCLTADDCLADDLFTVCHTQIIWQAWLHLQRESTERAEPP